MAKSYKQRRQICAFVEFLKDHPCWGFSTSSPQKKHVSLLEAINLVADQKNKIQKLKQAKLEMEGGRAQRNRKCVLRSM